MTLFKGELRRWLFRVLPIILVVCCPENLSARLGGGGGYSGGGGGGGGVGILEVVVTPGEGAILAEVGEVIPHLLRKTT